MGTPAVVALNVVPTIPHFSHSHPLHPLSFHGISGLQFCASIGFGTYVANSLTIFLPAVLLHILGFCTVFVLCSGGHDNAGLSSAYRGVRSTQGLVVSAEYCFLPSIALLGLRPPLSLGYYALSCCTLRPRNLFWTHLEPTQFHSGVLVSGEEGRLTVFPLHVIQASGFYSTVAWIQRF